MENTTVTKGSDMTKPDRTIRLSETTGLLARIAAAMIDAHGFYTFTDAETGEKVMVVR